VVWKKIKSMGSLEECLNNTFFSSYDDSSTSDPESTPSNCINESIFHNVTGKAPYEEYFVNIVVGIILGLLILVTVVGESFFLISSSLFPANPLFQSNNWRESHPRLLSFNEMQCNDEEED
jgi:hypothetical protein